MWRPEHVIIHDLHDTLNMLMHMLRLAYAVMIAGCKQQLRGKFNVWNWVTEEKGTKINMSKQN